MFVQQSWVLYGLNVLRICTWWYMFRIYVTVWCCASAAMAQRKSELLRLQTLERIAGFQQDLEGQLQIMLSNPELTVVK